MVWMTGKQMGGMEVDFVIEVYDETGEWPPGTHVHAFDECLVFFGWDEDMDYLGADMTLALGKEAEVHRLVTFRHRGPGQHAALSARP